MTSNSLATQLEQNGLCAIPAQLDDFVARATKARWSPRQILEELAKVETAERSRRSLERRLRISGIKTFKPIVDFDWNLAHQDRTRRDRARADAGFSS
ncbi:MAG: ATP-binding protein [Bryobacteraceae bacterium]